jgi:phosphohistidine phosphatase
MKLYLMQHGNPLSKEEDPERPLSDQGIEDVKKVADFLKNSCSQIAKILHSGKKRAEQTAEIISSRLDPGIIPVEDPDLLPKDDVRKFANRIKEFGTDILVVGHLPHLGKLASFLVTTTESIPIVAFQQGGIVCLSSVEGGPWTIDWMLVPGII